MAFLLPKCILLHSRTSFASHALQRTGFMLCERPHNKLAPEIQTLADRMCRHLKDDFAQKNKPLSLKAELRRVFPAALSRHAVLVREF